MYQTYQKDIITLQGTLHIKIKVLCCYHHRDPVIVKPSFLEQIVSKGRTYGLDVIIAVGLLRWGLNLQREEIRKYFDRKDIKISTGTISNLSFDFLLLLKQVHENRIKQLKRNLYDKNEMIIHVDATDENGGNAVFLIKDGKTEITLFAESIISEKEEYISPIFERFKDSFGKPTAIVRDMGSALIKSCNKVFPEVPQQICHYHFIRAFGNRLFNDIYSELRNAISDSNFIQHIRSLRSQIKKKLKCSSVLHNERHVLYWVHLVIDYLLYPLKKSMEYPFRLAYKEVYERVMEIDCELFIENRDNCVCCIKISQLSNLKEAINEFISNHKIQKIYWKLDKIWEWYIEIRKTLDLMRISMNETRILTEDEVDEMKTNLKELMDDMKKEGSELDEFYIKKSKYIERYFEKRWDELFIEIRDPNGKYIPIRRDNNIDELAHRWARMSIRRRTGRNRTQNEMYQVGALLSIFSNLFNEIYCKSLFEKVDNLSLEFSTLDWKKLLKERKKLFLDNDGLFIPVNDKSRKELIYNFVESTYDKPNVLNFLDEWLRKMDKHIECWDIDFVESDIDLEVI